jgi:hypothetical protein
LGGLTSPRGASCPFGQYEHRIIAIVLALGAMMLLQEGSNTVPQIGIWNLEVQDLADVASRDDRHRQTAWAWIVVSSRGMAREDLGEECVE